MKYLSTMRDVIIIFTTIITAIGIYVKTLNKLFLDIIKNEYRMIPGKNNVLDVIIKIIIYTGFVMGIIYLCIEIFQIMTVPYYIEVKEGIPTNIIQLIGFIIAIAFSFMITCTIVSILKIKDYLEQYDDYSKKINLRSKNFLGRNIYKLNCWNIVIESVFLGLSIFVILIFAQEDVKYLYTKTIITVLIFGIIALGALIITISLCSIMKALKEDIAYYLVTQNESIICRFFLEYEEYYLIIMQGNEKYIRKTDVKIIRKIKYMIKKWEEIEKNNLD